MTTSNTNFSSAIRINRKTRTIEITKSFNKAASRFGTDEYEVMQKVLNDHPGFRVEVKITRTKVDHFKGLTYEFMEKYIASHDDADNRMKEFNDLRATSEEAQLYGAVAVSYGEIKAWFIKVYPEIEEFQKRRETALAA